MRVTREGDNVPVLDIQGRVAIPRQAFENWWRAEMARKKAKNETYPNCATATAFLLKYLTADDRDLLCGKESRRSVNIIGGVAGGFGCLIMVIGFFILMYYLARASEDAGAKIGPAFWVGVARLLAGPGICVWSLEDCFSPTRLRIANAVLTLFYAPLKWAVRLRGSLLARGGLQIRVLAVFIFTVGSLLDLFSS
jgi:hypothetical protein